MCGIATVSIGRRARGRISYPKLREMVRELIVQLEERGEDASGIAVINEGGPHKSRVYKKPLRSSRLVVRPKFEETLATITEHTNFVLLHARATTVGSNHNPYDNHPIIADHVVGIHNGTLWNDDDLVKEFKLARKGKVDSEIIFRLFQKFLDEGLGPQESIRRVSKELIGAYTGAAVDLRYPYRMTMFRHDRPLSLVRVPYYDMLFAVSEVRLYDAALRKMKIKLKDKMLCVPEDSGFIVDLSTNEGSTDRVEDFPLPSYRFQSWSSTGVGRGYRVIDRRGVRAVGNVD